MCRFSVWLASTAWLKFAALHVVAPAATVHFAVPLSTLFTRTVKVSAVLVLQDGAILTLRLVIVSVWPTLIVLPVELLVVATTLLTLP